MLSYLSRVAGLVVLLLLGCSGLGNRTPEEVLRAREPARVRVDVFDCDGERVVALFYADGRAGLWRRGRALH